ncbi:MAG: phosphonate metabolism protein/1,5-bisphosphokinase (PRPP-forming) PhnN [Devosia sp.]
MVERGRLVLVVGPSGAGKDTLIGKAKSALAGDRRFVFPRRVITREAVASLEDHDTSSGEAFAAAAKSGQFALSWEAHGLSYGIPASIETDLAAGRTVIVNVSRKTVEAARRLHPDCQVLLIDAGVAVRAARLAARGRESGADIEARLQREGASLPPEVQATRIDNSGQIDVALKAFLVAVGADGGDPAPPY